MRKILLGAAAAMAIAAPSIASADTNAVVGLNYSNTDFGSGSDYDRYGIDGAFSHDLDNGAVFQMDGALGRTDFGACCYSSGYLAGHYAMRNDSHAIGGFVGLTDFFGFSGVGVGVEGQMFLGNLNLGGSVGYADFGDVDLSITSAQVDAQYFFTPNFAITGLAALSEADFPGSDEDVTTLGVGGEYRFSNSPFSISAGYRNNDFDGGDSDSWTVGLAWDLGTGSVQERTREGAGLNGARNLFGATSSLTP